MRGGQAGNAGVQCTATGARRCRHNPLPALSRIRAITLDLDDTLWPSAPTLARAEQRTYAYLAEQASAVAAMWSIEQLRELRLSIFNQHLELQHDFLRIRRMALRVAFEAAGLSGTAAHELIEHVLEAFMTARNQVDLYPEVRGCLTRLSQRFALASLTNGNADVARIGIGHHFKATISAHAHGASKPDPALFHIACRALACAPEEVVHVGDDIELDVRGGRTAGLRVIWMNRTHAVWQGDDQPVAVGDLLGLERWLDANAE